MKTQKQGSAAYLKKAFATILAGAFVCMSMPSFSQDARSPDDKLAPLSQFVNGLPAGLADTRSLAELQELMDEVSGMLVSEQETGLLRRKISDVTAGTYFSEGRIVYIPDTEGDLIVLGDTHGDTISVEAVLRETRFRERAARGEMVHLIFLGDYIDKGMNSLGNLKTVLTLKKSYPHKVTLLTGNHENIDALSIESERWSRSSGHSEHGRLVDQFNADPKLFGPLEASFRAFVSRLPVVAVTRNGIVLAHSSMPSLQMKGNEDRCKEGLLSLADREEGLYDPDSTERDSGASMQWEMVWSAVNSRAPEKDDRIYRYDTIDEESYNRYWIGADSFSRFMEAVGGGIFVRGHYSAALRDETCFDGRFVTVISTGGASPECAEEYREIVPRYARFDLARRYSEVDVGECIVDISLDCFFSSFKAIRDADESGMLERMIPRWADLKKMEQWGPHDDTVGAHILGVVEKLDTESLPQGLRSDALLMAFFHDFGKDFYDPSKKGQRDDHNIVGSHMVKEIMLSLGFSQKDADRISWYVKYHHVMWHLAYRGGIEANITAVDPAGTTAAFLDSVSERDIEIFARFFRAEMEQGRAVVPPSNLDGIQNTADRLKVMVGTLVGTAGEARSRLIAQYATELDAAARSRRPYVEKAVMYSAPGVVDERSRSSRDFPIDSLIVNNILLIADYLLDRKWPRKYMVAALASDAASERLFSETGIDLSEVSFEGGIVTFAYANTDGNRYILKAALKDSPQARTLVGYNLPLADRFTIKTVAEDRFDYLWTMAKARIAESVRSGKHGYVDKRGKDEEKALLHYRIDPDLMRTARKALEEALPPGIIEKISWNVPETNHVTIFFEEDPALLKDPGPALKEALSSTGEFDFTAKGLGVMPTGPAAIFIPMEVPEGVLGRMEGALAKMLGGTRLAGFLDRPYITHATVGYITKPLTDDERETLFQAIEEMRGRVWGSYHVERAELAKAGFYLERDKDNMVAHQEYPLSAGGVSSSDVTVSEIKPGVRVTVWELDPRQYRPHILVAEELEDNLYPVDRTTNALYWKDDSGRKPATAKDVRSKVPLVATLKERFFAKEPGVTIAAITGNENLFYNKPIVAVVGDKVYHATDERIDDKDYPMYVVWADGRVTIEEKVRFKTRGERKEPDIIIDGVSVSVAYATVIQLIKNKDGFVYPDEKNGLAYFYDDVRHLFSLPKFSNEEVGVDGLMSGGVFFMADQIIADRSRIERYFADPSARQRFDLAVALVDKDGKQIPGGWPVPPKLLADKLRALGYADDDFTISGSEISIRLKENGYPFHIVGVTKDGRAKEIAIESGYGENGISIREAAALAEREGLEKAGIIDQGTTVRLEVGGKTFAAQTHDKDDAQGSRASSVIVYTHERDGSKNRVSADVAWLKRAWPDAMKEDEEFDAEGVIGSITALALKAKREGQKLIIGLETGWIPGMHEKGGLQQQAMKPLLTEITLLEGRFRALGIDNVVVIHESGEALAGAIEKRAVETGTGLSHVVVFASKKTVESASFASFRNAEEKMRPFLAEVDPAEIERWYHDNPESSRQLDMRLMEMLGVTLALASGRDPPGLSYMVSYDKQKRLVVFMPSALPVDYDELKKKCDGQRMALQAA